MMGKGKTMGNKGLLKEMKKYLPFYMFLLPALILVILFCYLPMDGLAIAFKDYKMARGISGSDWVGLKHFKNLFSDPNFYRILGNTLKISIATLLTTFPVTVIFTILVNEIFSKKFKSVVQTITYMPHFLSEVVVCSLVILFLDRTSGPVNNLIAALGGERTAFMGIPKAFPSIYVFSGLWQSIGWSSILYISALSSISMEEVEAARIDGASRLQVLWHINIPGILPTIVITFLLRVGNLMSLGYTKILLLQNDLNLDVSTTISTYTYEIGMLQGQYSYSSAIGLFNNIINICVMLIANQISKKVSQVSLF